MYLHTCDQYYTHSIAITNRPRIRIARLGPSHFVGGHAAHVHTTLIVDRKGGVADCTSDPHTVNGSCKQLKMARLDAGSCLAALEMVKLPNRTNVTNYSTHMAAFHAVVLTVGRLEALIPCLCLVRSGEGE